MRTLIAAAATAFALALAPASAVSASAAPGASAAEARVATVTGTQTVAADGAVTVSVYAGDAGTVQSKQQVTITITVTNTTANVVPAATATLALTQSPLPTRRSLDDWLGSSGDAPATRVIGSVHTTLVAAGSNSRVATLTVPAASLALSGSTIAVYGLQATISDSAGAVGTARSSLVYQGSGTPHLVGLTVAMPITVPPVSTGLVDASDLATYTGPDGLLTRQLELARDHPSIAIAIDPMIIASIRVLGASAPASAQEWIQELDDLPNDSFPLQYGDADVATELQSGFTSLLQPSSFGYALDQKNFPSSLQIGETPTPTPTTNPFITPTPTAPATTVPTMQQLLSWPYTFSGIAWPADDSMRTSDLDALAAEGYPSTIVSGSNTNASSLSSTPNAALPVKGGTALVTDQGVSTALRAVIAASTTDEEGSALAATSAQLAEISGQSQGDTVVLAGLDRDWPANEGEATKALDTLFALPWVTLSSLRDALDAPATSGLKLVDATQPAARTAAVHELTADAGNLDAFSTVLTDPTVLTGRTRNQLLSLLGVGWNQPDNDWTQAVAAFHGEAVDTLASVQIAPTAPITVAATQTLIPVTVTNKSEYPVNVVLRATPSNARLEVDSDTPKTVPSDASAKLLVPVKAKLGNGRVKLDLQLYSPTGVLIGVGVTASVDVHADWEGLGALVLGIAFVLFFGFGLTRSILRRLASRRGDDRHPTDAALAAETPADATTDATESGGPAVSPDSGDDDAGRAGEQTGEHTGDRGDQGENPGG